MFQARKPSPLVWLQSGCLWVSWAHSPLPTPGLALDWEFWGSSILVSWSPLTMPFIYPSQKDIWPYPEGSMALSPDYWRAWAHTSTKVSVTGLGSYNISGNKDIQLHTAWPTREVPELSRGCEGWMLSSRGCRQSQYLFCTPTLKRTTSSCCWWMWKNRERERMKWVEGDRKREGRRQ